MGLLQRWKRASRGVRIAALAAGLLAVFALVFLAGLLYVAVRMTPRRPPVPEAFPACPEVPTSSYQWRGLQFSYPASWTVEEGGAAVSDANNSVLFILARKDDSLAAAVQSITILERRRDSAVRPAVEGVWSQPEGSTPDVSGFAMLGPDTVPQTVQKFKVSGREAVLSLQRGRGLLPLEHDRWRLLIVHRGDVAYEVASGALFDPYKRRPDWLYALDEKQVRHNEELACGFWAVVRSLELPK